MVVVLVFLIILAAGVLLFAGGVLLTGFMRWFDLNVQDIPFFKSMAWGAWALIGLVALAIGIAILVAALRYYRSHGSHRPVAASQSGPYSPESGDR